MRRFHRPNKCHRAAQRREKSRTEAIPTTVDPAETDACFIVRDVNRQALAYVYFRG